MLSYQHAYHAGNFADVHKHLTLYTLLRTLQRKESAITLVDTHAGRGLYPLADKAMQKNGEYRNGVARLWEQRDAVAVDSPLGDWMGRLATLQGGAVLRRYPGSPWWFADLQRKQDQLSLFELHPAEHQALEAEALSAGKRQQRLHADGLEGLRKMLPVNTPRLCVLIDPSYELRNEYQDVAKALRHIVRKARHAVVVIWYPLLGARRHERLLASLRQSGIPKLWHSELRLGTPPAEYGMHGSGLVLLNPPWQLDQRLDDTFKTVAKLLGDGASHRSAWLTGQGA
ncbi:23S rRNA (adenine(2030)-N(6))-methyltransferase RlmJ [Salinisphaera sp. RV14]|uniref:23S rRNA (adenine(2030)-N(6))-methyltransferase RlmJ n=1 Tax=Salinisphaera sp. RV14 TaxID=3454140 RepID=UPI003F84CD9D